MLELVIRPRARRDLKGIWAYTVQQWGMEQADRYLHDIDREILKLLQFPEIGTSYAFIRAGYRVLHVKRHLVFYLPKGQRLEIVRVLYEGMDVKDHL